MLRRPLVVMLAIAICACCAGAVQALGIAPSQPLSVGEEDGTQARAAARGVPVAGRVVVDTTADRPDADPGDGRCADRRGRCSLRAAVMEANAHDELRRIVLRRRAYTLRLEGAGEDEAQRGDLDVRRSLTIDGRGALIRGDGDRVLDVADGVRLGLSGLRIARGMAPGGEGGGAIRSRGRLALTRVKLLRNVASGDTASGGGILNDGGTVLLRASQVNRNGAGTGGGIASVGGDVLLRQTRVLVNVATDGGGLALAGSASASVRDSEIDRNRARGHGGGVHAVTESALAARRTSLDANVAGGAGGAVHAVGADVRLDRGTASGNKAGSDGGALRGERGDFVIKGTELLRNGAARDGGAVSSAAARTALTGVQVHENRGRRGAAVHVAGGALRIDSAVVQANRAADVGGALAVGGAGSVVEVVGDTYLIANQADGRGGGAIVNDGGRVTVAGGPISGNRAPGGAGGAILNRAGSVTKTGGGISRNMARSDGGGVALLGGQANLLDCVIDENTAARGGGLFLGSGTTATVGGERIRRISGNRASAQGGGLWVAAGAVLRLDTTVTFNVAPRGAQRFDAG